MRKHTTWVSVQLAECDDGFYASTPRLESFCVGRTEAEALHAIFSCAEKEGGVLRLGAPIIQHVIEVLGEHLRQLIAERSADVNVDANCIGFALHSSDAIAAVGTAIAALGRIKEA